LPLKEGWTYAVKRRELMKRIKAIAHEQGVGVEITEGSNHTLVRVGDRRTTIPRHTEINEITALNILKQIGAKR